MPVSHLGLTVSHIPSAASFYLSALQPLGYRFIGHQGDSIGLGIKDADFFITQGPRGATIAPTHIAFAADDRTQVRECYTSALKGGGRPNGPPGYRHNDCGCFNSAVEDLDGNTIEFIFRENGPCAAEEPAAAPSEHSRVLNWQEGVSREAQDGVAPQEDAASVMSKAKTAVDAASSASKSADKPAEEAPEAPASEKGVMAALAEGITPKAILGGAIGAVAAAGIAYAFYQSEQESAREEAAHKSSIAASSERGRRYSTQAPTQYAPMKRSISAAPPRSSRFHRNYSTTESVAPPPKTHRNFSVTESRVGPRPEPTQVPTQAPTAMKAIEARAFDNDSEIQAALSRHTSRRPTMARSQTFEPSVYTAPMSTATRSRAPPQRSATLADEPSVRSHLLLEGPKDLIPSSNSLRSNRDDDADLQRHDSAASAFSHRSSKHSRRDDGERRSSASQAPTVKSSSKRDDGERSQAGSIKSSSTLKRAASRYEESRSQRDPETLSDASTIKASRRDSAAHIPLPPSKASSKVSARTAAEYRLPDSAATSRAPTQVSAMPASRAQSHASAAQPSPAPMDSPVPSYYAPPPQDKPKSGSTASSQQTALRVPLPASRAPSQATAAPAPSQASRRGSQVSSRHPPAAMSRRLSHSSGSTVRYPAAIPLPASVAGQNYDDVEDSDGMGDIKTVVPDDSISCIDISQPKAPRSDYSRHSERSHRSHRTHHTSSRSKHPHRSSEDKSREPGDAQTIVPDDSISSVGSKHSHRSHREREHKSHHGGSSRSSRHHKSHSHEKKESSSDKDDDDEGKDADPTPLDARTVLPEESISSVGAPAPRSHYSDAKSHHSSSRSKHGSSRREDDGKSHHSSSGRSKHRSHKDEDGKERRRKEGGSEAGKSDATVKPAKSKVAGMSLPSILRGGREKERERERDERRSEKRSVVSHA